jgi:hypothetical protein
MNITSETLKQLADHNGVESRSYSGRFMYGVRCFAVVTDSPTDAVLSMINAAVQTWEAKDDFTTYAADLGEYLLELTDTLGGAKTDSTGRDTVVYWEHIEYTEVAEETEE